ncbi:MAG: NAD(P)/FAD-dependent oxidoreductase [Prevotella sp.]|nr:NAD(P)/FAD-dependent oxidoreductase [Prevotella sp.]
MNKTDLIVIGAGPGGYRAAEYAAKNQLKVVVFEGSDVGGTCLNVGCIPTKTYVHASTFAEARERQTLVVPQLRAGVEQILSHPNITLVREEGHFVDAHTVNDYTADNIIIATGSETKWLPIKGTDDPRVVDSTGLLNLEVLPKRLAIIGAGVIGMEFASVFSRFGSEVTVIEYLKECLPALDSDVAKRLRKYLERPRVGEQSSGMRPRVGEQGSGMRQGITFKMKTAVDDISTIDADVVLMATGRKPRVQSHFTNAGIEYDERKGITVDHHFATTVKGIYAIGDVNGRQMLAHAAEMQAIHVVNQILGKPDQIRFDVMPAAIFTEPEAACVGPTEEQLKEQGTAYECRKAFWRSNGKAMAMGQTEGMLKLFSEPDAGRLLGCHAYGAHAADIVQEVSVLMCCNATVGQLRHIVHIHPTLGEILLSAAEQ